MTLSTKKAAQIFYTQYMDHHDERDFLECIQTASESGNCAYVYHVNPWDDAECPFIHYVVANQPMTIKDLQSLYENDQENQARMALKDGDDPYDVFMMHDVCPVYIEQIAKKESITLAPNWFKANEAVEEAAPRNND